MILHSIIYINKCLITINYYYLLIIFDQAELHEKEQVVLNNQRRRAIKVYKNLEKLRTRMNDDDQVNTTVVIR